MVVVSLTRSNSKGSVGFLGEPERINVGPAECLICALVSVKVRVFVYCHSPFYTCVSLPMLTLCQNSKHRS